MEKELNTRCEMMVGHIIENTNTEMHGYGVFFTEKSTIGKLYTGITLALQVSMQSFWVPHHFRNSGFLDWLTSISHAKVLLAFFSLRIFL